MAALVREHGADVGFAFDGDADRVIFADDKGEILDGDQLMAVCASYYARQNSLNQNTVVATIMSNLGLEVALAKARGARSSERPSATATSWSGCDRATATWEANNRDISFSSITAPRAMEFSRPSRFLPSSFPKGARFQN